MNLAREGDMIEWSFPIDYGNERFDGKKFQAQVAAITEDKKHYCVYAEYGQDYIPVGQAKIIKAYYYIGIKKTAEEIVFVCNKEPKPQYRATANEQECTYYKNQYDSWEKNNEFIKAFNWEQEDKIIQHIIGASLPPTLDEFIKELEAGFEIDCVEIRTYKMINGVKLDKPTKLAYLKS
jgi:hypothetical protein